MSARAILTDTTRCVGCERCVVACKESHGLGDDVSRRWKRRYDDLSSTRFTTLEHRPGGRHVRKQCRHCLEPACVSACIVGALQKQPDGAVTYDPELCMGCRYCMVACPYGVPRYDWEAAVPYLRKCDMCHARLERGEEPACVAACPHQATVFGDRDQLLAEAHRRIRAAPARYLDRVWGEREVGGTSVLYISDIPLDFLANCPDLGDTPLPEKTWAALSKVPSMMLGVGGLMAGVWWITERRIKLAKESDAARAEEQDAAVERAAAGGDDEDEA